MAILALDLGTKAGYAIHRNGEITCGTQRFMQRRSWHPGRRWSDYRSWLSSLVADQQVTLIAYEDVKRHAGTYAAHCYGGFLSMTEMIAQQHNVELISFGVGTIKKEWAGKGNAKKHHMIAEAERRGFSPPDDNAADALAILHCALKEAV